jgi:branched-chain amino acid transport system ATP-binding protein
MPLLQIEHLSIFFGGLRAVHDFNLQIETGQVRGLIGPNGAGKSTIFNMITGIHAPTEGKITFQGENVIGLPPHKIAEIGIARTFQNLRLWRHMTVLEHVMMARYSKLSYSLFDAFLGTGKAQRQESESREKALELLSMFQIDHFASQVVTNLPYGVQRRVEMARAMAIEPKLLLLDEPTAGMNPEEMMAMVRVIGNIRDQFDVGIFLIEHRMQVVMGLCERIQTLNFGEVIAEGTPDEIRANPDVIDAYLGKEAAV